MTLYTTSVNYADLLAVTLPAWKSYGTVMVITREDDMETRLLCDKLEVICLVTDAWYANGSNGINKGTALNSVIHRISTPGDEVVLFDADSYPIGTLSNMADETFIVGCGRFYCPNSLAFNRRLIDPTFPLRKIGPGSYRPELVRGYFQQFVYQEHLSFGNKRHTTFSGCDLFFASQFRSTKQYHDYEFHVLHLGQNHRNWKGRITVQWL